MGKYDVVRAIPHVLHGRAAPISLPEFAEVVQATCPPRFPEAGKNQGRLRPVGTSSRATLPPPRVLPLGLALLTRLQAWP